VGRSGAIDWWCAPRFDSRVSFARLLDDEAGHWNLAPVGPTRETRSYLPDTMVLCTEHECEGGRIRVTDAMAFAPGARP